MRIRDWSSDVCSSDLILDEATEGLAPVIRRQIWAAIRHVKGRGQAILVVDKNLKDLLPLADACVILEKGVSVWHGSPAQLAGDAALQDPPLGAWGAVDRQCQDRTSAAKRKGV